MRMVTYTKLGIRYGKSSKDLNGALREDTVVNSLFDLSLLICTRNRAVQVAQTLKRVLAMQSRLAWELIIVDNGSKDRTSAVVARFAAAYDRPVQIITNYGQGVACAKNAGWRSARSAIVACIDDDCYPGEDYLDSIFKCFSNDPKLGFLGGRILLHDQTDRRITIQESLEPFSIPPGNFIRPGVIQGANVAYRRAALMGVGGFDPWFGAGAHYSGDETEVMARISGAGWNGAYDPKAVVYHHHGRKTANDEWRLMRWYDRGRGAYYAKCMLNRNMRNVYVRNWLLTRQQHSWKTTALEIAGGLEYVARAFISGR
jgi:glycosyltransferase involved in cell wall biosynthesis